MNTSTPPSETPPEGSEISPTTPSIGIEREVFGKGTLILRDITGSLAVITLCIVSLLNAYTMHLSVSGGGQWPDTVFMIIMNVGNVVVAWSFINTNKTLQTLLNGTPLSDKIRGKLSDVIAPDKKEDKH